MATPVGRARQRDPNDRMAALFRAIGVKGDLARAAERELRLTPEYAQARKERRAREWIAAESRSFAEAAYELLMARLRDLDP